LTASLPIWISHEFKRGKDSKMTEKFRLRWPVDRHVVNQYFGENPDFYKPFGLAGHEGLDFYAPMYANVYAAADGEIYQVGHPPDHPYGLHIRIKHRVGEDEHRTIYAHLAQASARVGQQVKAGDRIGQADNTGNSFGSHLHLTLKMDGAQTTGYPSRIVDPWPFLQETTDEQPLASDLIIYPTHLLSLRTEPISRSSRLDILSLDEPLTVLGDAEIARARIGKQGEWLQVQTESGLSGYVAAWYVRLTGQAAPASSLVVYPTDLLSVRARPSTDANRLVTVSPNDALQVLGDATSARAKLGDMGQWLNVKAPSGHVGYVAAWFVHEARTTAPPAPSPGTLPTLRLYPTVTLNLRADATTDSTKVGSAQFNRPVTVISDDPQAARAKVGQQDQWLYIETEDKVRGWAAAWFLSLNPT
jgi:uncharacterized protein YgiM (DUF1202 family)